MHAALCRTRREVCIETNTQLVSLTIYEFITKFGERLDEVEDLITDNRLWKQRTIDIGINTLRMPSQLLRWSHVVEEYWLSSGI